MKQYLIDFKYEVWKHAKDEAVVKIWKGISLINCYLSGKNTTKVDTWFSFCPSWWQTSDKAGLRWL